MNGYHSRRGPGPRPLRRREGSFGHQEIIVWIDLKPGWFLPSPRDVSSPVSFSSLPSIISLSSRRRGRRKRISSVPSVCLSE